MELEEVLVVVVHEERAEEVLEVELHVDGQRVVVEQVAIEEKEKRK
jgi:hypothetical protein